MNKTRRREGERKRERERERERERTRATVRRQMTSVARDANKRRM